MSERGKVGWHTSLLQVLATQQCHRCKVVIGNKGETHTTEGYRHDSKPSRKNTPSIPRMAWGEIGDAKYEKTSLLSPLAALWSEWEGLEARRRVYCTALYWTGVGECRWAKMLSNWRLVFPPNCVTRWREFVQRQKMLRGTIWRRSKHPTIHYTNIFHPFVWVQSCLTKPDRGKYYTKTFYNNKIKGNQVIRYIRGYVRFTLATYCTILCYNQLQTTI